MKHKQYLHCLWKHNLKQSGEELAPGEKGG